MKMKKFLLFIFFSIILQTNMFAYIWTIYNKTNYPVHGEITYEYFFGSCKSDKFSLPAKTQVITPSVTINPVTCCMDRMWVKRADGSYIVNQEKQGICGMIREYKFTIYDERVDVWYWDGDHQKFHAILRSR